MSDAEEVGSVGEEAWKLWRALSESEHGTAADQTETTVAPHDPSTSGIPTSGCPTSGCEEPHACPAGWCPICQVVGFVREHPEAVAHVGASAASLLHSIRDLLAASKDPR